MAAAVAAVVLALLLASLPASAQDAGRQGVAADTLQDRRSAVLRSLERGERVRVGVAGGGRVVGDVLRSCADTLVLDPWRRPDGARRAGRAPRALSPSAVERLWTRRSSWDRGALIGGGVGAVPGAVFGHALGEFACAETSDECGFQGALIGGALLGAGGALLGAGVGALIPRWSREFP